MKSAKLIQKVAHRQSDGSMAVGEKLFQNKYIRIAGILLGTYLLVRYLVPLMVPFFIAGYLAILLRPSVCFLHRKTHINVSILSSVLLVILGGILGLILWLAAWELCRWLTDFLCNLDKYKDCMLCTLRDCSCRLESATGLDGKQIEESIIKNANIFINNLQITYLPKLMNHSFLYLTNVIRVIGTVMIVAIATVFLIKDYEVILGYLHKNEITNKALIQIKKTLYLVRIYLKAQLIILSVISLLLVLSFYLLGISDPIAKGIMIGVLDALPFIGTGLILFPWSVIDLIQGNYLSGIAKVLLFIICAILRDVLEPKLMGRKIGVLPILLIMSVYIGARALGIFGIVIGPILLLIVVEANKN